MIFFHGDHPRLCGEYLLFFYFVRHDPGSPPSMRGIRVRYPRRVSLLRITPVYAGNTEHSAWTAQYGEDHPRLCGEYLKPLHIHHKGFGSPPSMRGILSLSFARRMAGRITPVYAGNTYRFKSFISQW